MTQRQDYGAEVWRIARQMMSHLEAKDDAISTRVLQVWRDRDEVDRVPSRATVAFVNGRLQVGTVSCPRDSAGKWNTRVVVAMARAASADTSNCVAYTTHLLKIATEELGWTCEIDCDACYETGVCVRDNCPKCEWKMDECSKKEKFVWPELVGRPAWLAALILRELNPSKRVVLDTFDTLYQTPANPDVIRIVYDARTGFVTTPPPHVTTAPEISTPRDACFLSPEQGLCLGAPPNPPPREWSGFIGQRVGDVVSRLRKVYVHAAVVAVPTSQIITRDYRHDRIRVRFDPATMTVTTVPTVG